MPSVWLSTRAAKNGTKRHRVMYRLGGRETDPRYGGSFKTKREALARKAWIAGELAALRVPEIGFPAEQTAPTLAEAATRWQRSRLDVSEATKIQHRTALNRALPILGGRRIDSISAQDIADLVAQLAEAGKARESIRKTITALAMVFDHAGIAPNPARDRTHVKLPREEPEEFSPPTAAHVAAVYRLIPAKHRLPLLFLALRTSIAKACRALAIPLFSPHDLRHRRISLLHLSGEPWARIGEFVGQRNLKTTAETYTHVMLDEGEVDYAALLQ